MVRKIFVNAPIRTNTAFSVVSCLLAYGVPGNQRFLNLTLHTHARARARARVCVIRACTRCPLRLQSSSTECDFISEFKRNDRANSIDEILPIFYYHPD